MSILADLVDAALDGSVIGGYTRIGPAVRRRIERWSPSDAARLDGRTVVLTGATSGIGRAAAGQLAAIGASLEIVARDRQKAERLCAELSRATGNTHIGWVEADTGDLEAVRRAAGVLLQRQTRIDVLIHNAGALDDTWRQSRQGIEQTVASQVVGPFLLTGLLLPALKAAAPSRVIWVSSGGMYAEPLAVDRLEMAPDGYDGTTAYARAKRAQVTLAGMLAERLAADRVFVHAMHPGWADTPGVARSLPRFRKLLGPLLRTPGEAADTVVWLASDPDAPLRQSGLFWHDRRPRPLHRLARTRTSDTPEERRRLWAWVEARSGIAV